MQLAALSLFLAVAAGKPDPGVLHAARSGALEVRFLAAPLDRDTCASMQLWVSGRRAPAARFDAWCSAVRPVFSPGGRWALFQLGPMGPFHVVATPSLPLYADGGMPDAVVYPSEPAGMPPRPERRVTFLRWSGEGAFEMTGIADGMVDRFTYDADAGRITATCFVDGMRRQCAFPSPDGKYTVFVPRDGFHVVGKDAIPGFLQGHGGGTRFPAALPPGLARAVFQRWSGTDVVLQAVTPDGSAVEVGFSPATGAFSTPTPVPLTWPGWPAD